MRRAIRRFFRVNCTDAMTKWKKKSLQMVENNREKTTAELQLKSDDFEAFV
jgi:hypothetical protein